LNDQSIESANCSLLGLWVRKTFKDVIVIKGPLRSSRGYRKIYLMLKERKADDEETEMKSSDDEEEINQDAIKIERKIKVKEYLMKHYKRTNNELDEVDLDEISRSRLSFAFKGNDKENTRIEIDEFIKELMSDLPEFNLIYLLNVNFFKKSFPL